ACRLRIPSQVGWIEPTVQHLVSRATQCGAVRPARASSLTLALHEALTNAVIHGNLDVSSELKEQGDHAFAEAVAARCAGPAYGGRLVEVEARFDGHSAAWVFTDQGKGFDHAAALRRLEEPPDPEKPSGRGLVMMRAFVDEVRFEQGGRRVLLGLHEAGAGKRASERHPIQQPVRVAPLGPDGVVDWSAAEDALARDVSRD